MSIEELNELRHYYVWILDKQIGTVLYGGFGNFAMLWDLNEKEVEIQPLEFSYSQYGTEMAIHDKKKIISRKESLNYTKENTSKEVLGLQPIVKTDIVKVREKIKEKIPYKVGEVFTLLYTRYLVLSNTNDEIELLIVSFLEDNFKVKDVVNMLSKERPWIKSFSLDALLCTYTESLFHLNEKEVEQIAIKLRLMGVL